MSPPSASVTKQRFARLLLAVMLLLMITWAIWFSVPPWREKLAEQGRGQAPQPNDLAGAAEFLLEAKNEHATTAVESAITASTSIEEEHPDAQTLHTPVEKKPVEFCIEYSSSGKKAIHVSAVNTTGSDLKCVLCSTYGFLIKVQQDNGPPILIPHADALMNTSEIPATWNKEETFSHTFDHRALRSLPQGNYRASIFWNGANDYRLEKADVAVKHLSFTVDEQGDWNLEADENTVVIPMTNESFYSNHPHPVGFFATQKPALVDSSLPD